MTSTANDDCTPYFTIPSDPSFSYPLDDFPPLSLFESTISHAALIIPVKRTAELRRTLKHVLLRRPKTKNVYEANKGEAIVGNVSHYRKLVLKNDDDTDVLADPIVLDLLKDTCIQASTHTITFGYADQTVEQVLHRLLPFPEVPSSFEIVGHIAHLNLKKELLPFEHIIGKVLLDKNQPRIQTVVNKLGQIETEYRTFGMKVIAGSSKENWSLVKVKEEGCQFTLDFQKVYWNSRLGHEHSRLVKSIQAKYASGVVVADIMAGVGPFAVPLTRLNSKIVVHANDLNPASFQYLNVNSSDNKCGENLHAYNMDGRAFVHELQDDLVDFQVAIMNLPATAPQFLDAFRGFAGKTLPEIHVYCFGGKDDGAVNEAIERCQRVLGCTIQNASVRVVRDVAPNKNMLCVSFVLPEEARSLERIVVAPRATTTSNEPPPKRPKVD